MELTPMCNLSDLSPCLSISTRKTEESSKGGNLVQQSENTCKGSKCENKHVSGRVDHPSMTSHHQKVENAFIGNLPRYSFASELKNLICQPGYTDLFRKQITSQKKVMIMLLKLQIEALPVHNVFRDIILLFKLYNFISICQNILILSA